MRTMSIFVMSKFAVTSRLVIGHRQTGITCSTGNWCMLCELLLTEKSLIGQIYSNLKMMALFPKPPHTPLF